VFSFSIGRRRFAGDTFRELVKDIRRGGYWVDPKTETERSADVYIQHWGPPVTITTETTFCGLADVVRELVGATQERKAHQVR
jgi:hypothetical protein